MDAQENGKKDNGQKKENRFSIHASTIFRNLIFLMIICVAVYFTYSVISGRSTEESSEPPFTPVTEFVSMPEPATEPDADSSAGQPATSSEDQTTSSDQQNDSSSDSWESVPDDTNPGEYDAEFFSDTLFIGDSISTGLSLYGFLDADNVFAQQGLAPSTLFSTEIDGKTCESAIASATPERIVVMLGSNGIGYGPTEDLASSMGDCIKTLRSLFKGELVVVSIPPVTMEAEASDDNMLTLSAVKEYNTLVEKYTKENNAVYVDIYSELTDDSGYFSTDYAERDGIHFMGTAYQVMLSTIQSALTD